MNLVRFEDVKEFPEWRELTPEELKEAYALSRAAFTAEDLAGYAEEWRGVPMEQFLAELDEQQRIHGPKDPRESLTLA